MSCTSKNTKTVFDVHDIYYAFLLHEDDIFHRNTKRQTSCHITLYYKQTMQEKKGGGDVTAHYMSPEEIPLHETRNITWGTRVKMLLSTLMVAVFMGVAFFTATTTISTPAYADEEEVKKAQEALQNSLKDYSDGTIGGAIEQYNLEKSAGTVNEDTFAYVVQRLFVPGYMNRTTKAVDPDGQPKEVNCDVNDPNAGTVLYHNCDVPNIMTEFLQTFISFVVPTGVQNASTDYALVENPWFGMPTTLPAGEVPVDENMRTSKYTALELYGYGMKLTNYNGEWDNIKVFTSARALSNFSGADKLTVGINSITNGLTSGVSNATSNFTNSISRGDILGAFGSAYKGFFEAGTASTINTILDTSDYNVFKTWSWYRVGFGSTAYGFRELTESEIADRQLAYFQEHMLGQDGVLKLPEDFLKLETAPSRPKENIASCRVADPNNPSEEKELGSINSTQNSLTEDECRTKASETNPDNNNYTYTKDGLQKAETLKDWKEANKEWFDIASKYNMQCTIDTENETYRTSNLISFYSCVEGQYRALAENQNEQIRAEASKNLVKDAISAENFAKVFTGNTPANPNSPLARYVCVDNLGRDLINDGQKVYAFNNDGTPNSQCGTIRPPIQNGLFGNGYTDTDAPVDTRNEVLKETTFGIVPPHTLFFSLLSNSNLNLTSFITRVANTSVNLSFSPLAKTLGLDDLAVKFVEDLRESVFLPVAVLFVSLSALLIFVNMAFRGLYMQGLVALAYIVATYIVSAAILFNPKAFVTVVDEVPGTIEGALATAIFETGSTTDNELCYTTGDGIAYGSDKEQTLFAYANNGVRGIMCQVWYVYTFNPYVNAQWGTNYKNLYAVTAEAPNGFTNTNTDLVGGASINMGGGVTVNNWALYQLETLSVGTTTTIPDEYGIRLGQVDPNIYRIVDLQAGINNGAGTDPAHFDNWRGAQPAERLVTTAFGALNSIVGAIAIAVFSINKIIITFITLFMLLGLPFVLLIGLFYNGGKQVMLSYAMTVLSLIVERIFAVVLLALMLRFLLVVSQLTMIYVFAALISMIIALAFLMLRKKLMGWIRQTMTARYGETGGKLTSFSNQSWKDMMDTVTPRSVRNVVKNRVGDAQALTGAWVAGALSAKEVKAQRDANGNIIKSGKTRKQVRQESMSRTINDMRRRNYNMQRKEGFSVLQRVQQASNEGKVTGMKQVSEEYRTNKDTNQDYSENLQQNLDTFNVRKENRPQRKKTVSLDFELPTGNENFVDKMARRNNKDTTSIHSASQYRNVANINKARRNKVEAEQYGTHSGLSDDVRRDIRENPTFDKINNERGRVFSNTAEDRENVSAANDVYQKYLGILAEKEARRIKTEQDLQDFKRSIDKQRKAYLQSIRNTGNNTP